MTRSTINSYQKRSATIVPEFDFSTVDISTLPGNAGATKTLIPYSQFQSETGVSSPHPLANLGQTKVMKIVISGSPAGAIHYINVKELAAAIDISAGAFGCYVYMDDRTETGAVGPFTFWANESALTNHYKPIPSNFSSPLDDEWCFLGGITEAGYLSGVGGSPDATAIDWIRHTINTAGDNPTFYLTSLYYGAKRRPTFMLEQDDLNADTDQFIADCETYGFKGGMNAYSENVDGVGGKPTTAEMITYIDSGHAVYTHNLVEYDAVSFEVAKAAINTELDFWGAFYPEKLDDTTLMHHALPGGKQTKELREWMRGQGFKTIRNVGSITIPENAFTGQPEYNSAIYTSLAALAIDAISVANFKIHVDTMIQYGQDTCFYVHLEHANQQELFAYLKLKQDQGLCEVMPRHEWYEKSIAQHGTRSAV